MVPKDKLFDCLIIGTGPAGLTAAVYAIRGNMKVAIIEKSAPGGKVLKTGEIENYTGFNSITGPDLAIAMFNQTMELGVEYIQAEITEINKLEDGNFELIDSENNKLYTRAIIVATGTREREVGVPGESEYYGRGVSYCAVCDAALYKNQRMVVVGGGNSAIEESLYLTRFTDEIHLIHRRDVFRADKIVLEKAKKHPAIKMHLFCVLVSVEGDESVKKITYRNTQTNEVFTIDTNIIFPFIGSDPITSFLKKFDVLDDLGYVVVNDKMETKVPGLFSAGDINQKYLRQIVTAVSDGGVAAQAVIHYIDNLNNK